MKQKKMIFIAITIIVVVATIGYLRFKYIRYNNFIVAVQALPFEPKLAQFYEEFAHLPRSSDEYLAFARRDSHYSERLNKTGCYLKYDSLKEAVFLYSPGFDGDDDNLLKTYNPNQETFASSLLKDGDVLLQVKTVTDFLWTLAYHFVALREDKPDSTLKPIQHRLFRLAQCYTDTVMSVEARLSYPIPPGAEAYYGTAWAEFRKSNSTLTLRLYSELDPSLIRRVEKGLLAEVNKRDIVRDVNNVVIGFSINLLLPQFCKEDEIDPNGISNN